MTGPLVVGDDTPDRVLTESERAEQYAHSAALRAWTSYLSNVGAVRTLDAAQSAGAPLRGRQRPVAVTDDRFGGFDGWLNARHAHRYLTGRGNPDRVGPDELAEALVWMGARRASTLRGEDEGARRSPHRDVPDFYRVTVEVTWRLLFGGYTPMLRSMPGRPVAVGSSPSVRRAALRMGSDELRRLVGAVVAERAPTLLLERATDGGRPLVLRRGGRPRRSGWPNLDRDGAVIGCDVLAEAARTEGVRLRVPACSVDTVRIAVERIAVESPTYFAVVHRTRPVDCRTQVYRRTGWVRVGLAAVGRGPWTDDELDGEVTELRGRRPIDYLTTTDGRWVNE